MTPNLGKVTLDLLQLVLGFVFYFITSVILSGARKYMELYAADLYEKRHK